ncbi:hypothetical protein ACEPAI_1916 [Sanghuangporus weigelae]
MKDLLEEPLWMADGGVFEEMGEELSLTMVSQILEVQRSKARLELNKPFWLPVSQMWPPKTTWNWAESVSALADCCAMLNVNSVELEALKAWYHADKDRPKAGSEEYRREWRASITHHEATIRLHQDGLKSLGGCFREREQELAGLVAKVDVDLLWRFFFIFRRLPGTNTSDIWSEDGWLVWQEIWEILKDAPLEYVLHVELDKWAQFEVTCSPPAIRAASALVALHEPAQQSGTSSSDQELTPEDQDWMDVDKVASAVRDSSPLPGSEQDERRNGRPPLVEYSDNEEAAAKDSHNNSNSSNNPPAVAGPSLEGLRGNDNFGAIDDGPLFLPEDADGEENNNSSSSNPAAADGLPIEERVGSMESGKDHHP